MLFEEILHSLYIVEWGYESVFHGVFGHSLGLNVWCGSPFRPSLCSRRIHTDEQVVVLSVVATLYLHDFVLARV